MRFFPLSSRVILFLALSIFALGAFWLTAVPDSLQPSTYASIAALLTALTAIAMKTTTGNRLAAIIPRIETTAGNRVVRRPVHAAGFDR